MKLPVIPSPLWCALSVLLAFVVSSALPIVDLSYTQEPSSWFPLVNGLSNAYHLWRIDPLCSAILSFETQTAASDGVPLTILVLTLGTGLLARRIRPTLRYTPFTLWMGAALSTMAASLTVGRDAVVFGTLAWIPLFSIVLAASITAVRRGLVVAAAPLWIALLFTAVQNSHSANQLSLLSSLFSLLVALTLTAEEPCESRRAPLGYCIIFILGFLPALYTTVTAPVASLPDYPSSAHLVPDDGIPGIAQPNVGADYPLATVNRVQLKETFAPWAVVLFLANVLILARFGMRAENKPAQLFSITGAALAVALICDTLLPEQLSLISPLLSLGRSIPSATLIGTTALATGACVWITSLAALVCASGIGVISFVSFMFISSCILLFQFYPSLAAVSPSSDFLERARAVTVDTPSLRRIMISPSLHTVEYFDPLLSSLTKSPESLQYLTVVPPVALQPALAVFESTPGTADEKFNALMDGSLSSRWNPRSGGQHPGDTLLIRLQSLTQIAGLVLGTGDFPTDFPRGLLVEVMPSCDERGKGEAIAVSPSWQGSLLFSESGYPFFSGQEIVRVLLPKTVQARCVKITQTGHSATFDWSIAEIGLVIPQLPVPANP